MTSPLLLERAVWVGISDIISPWSIPYFDLVYERGMKQLFPEGDVAKWQSLRYSASKLRKVGEDQDGEVYKPISVGHFMMLGELESVLEAYFENKRWVSSFKGVSLLEFFVSKEEVNPREDEIVVRYLVPRYDPNPLFEIKKACGAVPVWPPLMGVDFHYFVVRVDNHVVYSLPVCKHSLSWSPQGVSVEAPMRNHEVTETGVVRTPLFITIEDYLQWLLVMERSFVSGNYFYAVLWEPPVNLVERVEESYLGEILFPDSLCRERKEYRLCRIRLGKDLPDFLIEMMLRSKGRKETWYHARFWDGLVEFESGESRQFLAFVKGYGISEADPQTARSLAYKFFRGTAFLTRSSTLVATTGLKGVVCALPPSEGGTLASAAVKFQGFVCRLNPSLIEREDIYLSNEGGGLINERVFWNPNSDIEDGNFVRAIYFSRDPDVEMIRSGLETALSDLSDTKHNFLPRIVVAICVFTYLIIETDDQTVYQIQSVSVFYPKTRVSTKEWFSVISEKFENQSKWSFQLFSGITEDNVEDVIYPPIFWSVDTPSGFERGYMEYVDRNGPLVIDEENVFIEFLFSVLDPGLFAIFSVESVIPSLFQSIEALVKFYAGRKEYQVFTTSERGVVTVYVQGHLSPESAYDLDGDAVDPSDSDDTGGLRVLRFRLENVQDIILKPSIEFVKEVPFPEDVYELAVHPWNASAFSKSVKKLFLYRSFLDENAVLADSRAFQPTLTHAHISDDSGLLDKIIDALRYSLAPKSGKLLDDSINFKFIKSGSTQLRGDPEGLVKLRSVSTNDACCLDGLLNLLLIRSVLSGIRGAYQGFCIRKYEFIHEVKTVDRDYREQFHETKNKLLEENKCRYYLFFGKPYEKLSSAEQYLVFLFQRLQIRNILVSVNGEAVSVSLTSRNMSQSNTELVQVGLDAYMIILDEKLKWNMLFLSISEMDSALAALPLSYQEIAVSTFSQTDSQVGLEDRLKAYFDNSDKGIWITLQESYLSARSRKSILFTKFQIGPDEYIESFKFPLEIPLSENPYAFPVIFVTVRNETYYFVPWLTSNLESRIWSNEHGDLLCNPENGEISQGGKFVAFALFGENQRAQAEGNS